MNDPLETGTVPLEVHGNAAQPLGMSATRFLADYWQKRPLLIRGAFANFQPPLAPDDLAGLACEDAALSRLIRCDENQSHWTVQSGPFDESIFATLPDHHWTLLVEDVDKWDADVAALRQQINFLPSWRIDDVMVSYAEDGGGVGAHVDQYDVFLLQGLGQRQWAISTDPHAPMDFRNDVEIRQLKHFVPTHEWLLEPGDVLYLPPGVPHRGVAVGACMTFSLGMRAPGRAELLLDAAEHLAEAMSESQRLTDPDLLPARSAGEIDAAALARVGRALGPLAQAFDGASLACWFGAFITRYRSAQLAAPPPQPLTLAQLQATLASGTKLVRHPWSRMAWAGDDVRAWLFAAGQTYAMPAELARVLCTPTSTLALAWPHDAHVQQALLGLINDGHFIIQTDD